MVNNRAWCHLVLGALGFFGWKILKSKSIKSTSEITNELSIDEEDDEEDDNENESEQDKEE